MFFLKRIVKFGLEQELYRLKSKANDFFDFLIEKHRNANCKRLLKKVYGKDINNRKGEDYYNFM